MRHNFNLVLYNSIKRGNQELGYVTARMIKTWRRSIRAVGGYWIGTAEYEGTRIELTEMFLEGLMREVRELVGGLITWQGYIAEMELTLNGVAYTRSVLDLANAVKCIYTRLFDDLLTNGGAETGAWTAINSATVTQATDWINTGEHSCKVVVADTATRGARIGTATIAAGIAYTLTGVLNIGSGAWRVFIKRTDTGAEISSGVTHDDAGDVNVSIYINANNTYAGTVNIDLLSVAAAGTCWGDSFSMRRAPESGTQTGWYIDLDSMTEYGRMELAELLVGMTNEAANSKAQTELRRLAWPRTTLSGDLSDFNPDVNPAVDKLRLTLHGYVHTLANQYCLGAGITAVSSAHVATIIGESEFISAGTIATNANPFMIDDRAPIRHWQALTDIIEAGDASGTGKRWVGGVYADRLFDYGEAADEIGYYLRNGRYYDEIGSAPLEPWFALPGKLLSLDDAPVGPGAMSGYLHDDPRVQFVGEVEMGPATDEQPWGTLTMREVSQ